jgi:hypothetical protein
MISSAVVPVVWSTLLGCILAQAIGAVVLPVPPGGCPSFPANATFYVDKYREAVAWETGVWAQLSRQYEWLRESGLDRCMFERGSLDQHLTSEDNCSNAKWNYASYATLLTGAKNAVEYTEALHEQMVMLFAERVDEWIAALVVGHAIFTGTEILDVPGMTAAFAADRASILEWSALVASHPSNSSSHRPYWHTDDGESVAHRLTNRPLIHVLLTKATIAEITREPNRTLRMRLNREDEERYPKATMYVTSDQGYGIVPMIDAMLLQARYPDYVFLYA